MLTSYHMRITYYIRITLKGESDKEYALKNLMMIHEAWICYCSPIDSRYDHAVLITSGTRSNLISSSGNGLASWFAEINFIFPSEVF